MSFSLQKKEVNLPDFKCNKYSNTVNLLKQYSSVPYGQSLLAIFLVDPNNRDMQISISYGGETNLNDVVNELFGIWLKYEPTKTIIRSFKKDGVYLNDVDGIELQHTNTYPSSQEEYGGKHVIVDVEMYNDNTYNIALWRYPESSPRMLKLLYKV